LRIATILSLVASVACSNGIKTPTNGRSVLVWATAGRATPSAAVPISRMNSRRRILNPWFGPSL
jgi:hypothetical protein